jgi:hypothetical protein
MRIVSVIAFAAALVLVGTVKRGGQTETKAVVDKAVKALGSAEKLTKYQAVTVKGPGKFHSPAEIMFTHEGSMQVPDKFRFEFELDIQGNKVAEVFVLNGDKGWISVAGKTQAMPKDTLEAFRDYIYAIHLATLPVQLKAKGIELSSLGEVKVGERPAVGLLVRQKGRRDVSLFFDKEHGYPLKSEITAKDFENGQEIGHEFTFSAYRDFDGGKSYAKMAWKKDGKLYLEREITELKWSEGVADAVFAEP